MIGAPNSLNLNCKVCVMKEAPDSSVSEEIADIFRNYDINAHVQTHLSKKYYISSVSRVWHVAPQWTSHLRISSLAQIEIQNSRGLGLHYPIMKIYIPINDIKLVPKKKFWSMQHRTYRRTMSSLAPTGGQWLRDFIPSVPESHTDKVGATPVLTVT